VRRPPAPVEAVRRAVKLESKAVASLLVDSPPAQEGEHQQGASPGAPAGPGGPPESAVSPPVQHSCANCGAPLANMQDWCLQCGAGAPGSLGAGAAGWRSTTAILAAVAALVLGAAVAAYAALNHSAPKARTITTTVAQATPVVPPAATTPVVPSKASTQAVKPVLPLGAVKPPKIPLTASTPEPSGAAKVPAKAPAVTPTPTGTTKQPSSPAGGSTTGESKAGEAPSESQQAAIVLDTDAASTYNPYDLPAAGFGDPSLAIDGDPTTAWTAQVIPATAPKMAEGLLIDLKSPQRLSVAAVVTSTPGMTIQVYGADTPTAPTSITDPAWATLSSSTVDKKKDLRIKLRHSSKAFRFITLWISQAAPASVGTEQAPGHVSVNELELFPAS
jgi:hypothetical protein